MKKLFALFIVVAILTLTATTVAAADEKKDTFDTYVNLEYGYSYDSYVSAEGRTINMYVKNTNAVSAGNVSCQSVAALASVNGEAATQKIEATKSLLCNMGMDEEVVDSLTREELNDYADAESITTIIEYTKTDAEGNTVIIDERTANAETQAIGNDQIIIGGPDIESDIYNNGYEDSYMRLVLTVIKLEGSLYSYTANAKWLKGPHFLAIDSFGICAGYSTPIASTYSGWYSYYRVIDAPGYEDKTIKMDFEEDDFRTAIGNGVGGMCVIFDFPSGSSESAGVHYSDYMLHISCQMTMAFPKQDTTFNVSATYVHHTVIFSFLPSISISLDGLSIGMGLEKTTDVRTVTLKNSITYIYTP